MTCSVRRTTLPWGPKYYSEAIEMKYSVSDDGRVATEDKTVYTKEEVEILKDIGGIDKTIHLTKKVFDGTII